MGFVQLLLLVLVDHTVVVEMSLLARDLGLALDVVAESIISLYEVRDEDRVDLLCFEGVSSSLAQS